MLVANYLSADDLGIAEHHRDALIELLRRLETGEIEKAPGEIEKIYAKPRNREFFHLGSWNQRCSCGTVRCIGGWAEHISGHTIDKMPVNFRVLCYPGLIEDDCDNVYDASVEQAAHALRNYLTLGEPMWSEVMAA